MYYYCNKYLDDKLWKGISLYPLLYQRIGMDDVFSDPFRREMDRFSVEVGVLLPLLQ